MSDKESWFAMHKRKPMTALGTWNELSREAIEHSLPFLFLLALVSFTGTSAAWLAYLNDYSATGIHRKKLARNVTLGLGLLGLASYYYDKQKGHPPSRVTAR